VKRHGRHERNSGLGFDYFHTKLGGRRGIEGTEKRRGAVLMREGAGERRRIKKGDVGQRG